MTTAFQPNAFQPNAFQVAGGVSATDFEVTITFTQDSDGMSVDLGLARGGVPGDARLWVAMVNGRRVVGSYWDIRRAIEEMAEENAAKDMPLAKPRRTRIVVQPGRAVERVEAPIPEPVAKDIQQKVRDLYQVAYARAKLQLEEDDEETLALLL